MYIRSKPVVALYKLLIGILALSTGWFLLGKYSWTAFRLFPTWVLLLAAIYYLFSTLVITLNRKRDVGKSLCPMLEGMIIMGFVLISGMALDSLMRMAPLPVLDTWVVVMAAIILPILTVLDWVLFVKKGRWRPMNPIYWLALPVCYAATMLFTAELLPSDITDLAYPLPMLDYRSYGLWEMLLFMLIITLVELSLGYILYILDFALSGKLAKNIVLPHIRVVEVDANGNELIMENEDVSNLNRSQPKEQDRLEQKVANETKTNAGAAKTKTREQKKVSEEHTVSQKSSLKQTAKTTTKDTIVAKMIDNHPEPKQQSLDISKNNKRKPKVQKSSKNSATVKKIPIKDKMTDNAKVAKKDKERTNDAEKLNTLNTDDGTTKISKIDHKRSNQKNVKKTQPKPKIRKF